MEEYFRLEAKDMKKIGIITLNGDNNYGNRLQNYALEQAIKSLGYEAQTMIFPEKKRIKDHLGKVKKNLNSNYREEQKKFRQMNELKNSAFQPFREQYLNNRFYSRKDDFSSFDRFITGSDQVWNPSWHLIDDNWLRFAPQEKRFSYAASMATTQIHKSNMEKLPKYLKEMNGISVRESESVEFVKELTGRAAKLVVDPTMLLSKEKYEKLISEQPHTQVKTDKPYILIYSLTGLTEDINKKVKEMSKSRNLEVFHIMGNQYKENYKVYNPIEFIEAINNAELVLSDSFHCGVFSILFETQFVLFNRNDGQPMNSRITTLLSKFNLMDQFYTGGDLSSFMNIDFSLIAEKLKKERKVGIEYLKHILSKPI